MITPEDVPNNVIVGGIPAKIIKTITDDKENNSGKIGQFFNKYLQ